MQHRFNLHPSSKPASIEVLEPRRLLSASGHVVYTFTGGNDGSGPTQGLVADGNGNLFGTTSYSTQHPLGTIFELTPGSNTPTTIYVFNNSAYQGNDRVGSLAIDAAGNLYGVGTGSYNSDNGRVFEYVKSTNTVVDLVVFNGANGERPIGSLSIDGSGNLFGATSAGGANGTGTIFEITAQNHSLKTLYNFAAGSDLPVSPVTLDASGNLFGATQSTGTPANPTIYELPKNGNSITTLYTFSGNFAGAAAPSARLAVDAADDVFATTFYYSPSGYQAHLLEVMPGQSSAIDRGSFILSQPYIGGATSDLVFDSSGNLFGGSASGPVFELPKGASTLSVVYTFPGLVNTATGPEAGIVLDSNGNLFGTSGGGDNSAGTIVEVNDVGSGGQFAQASNGILTITGTPLADTITVTDVNGSVTAVLNGQSEGPFTGITQINVLALAGSDSVSLAGVPINSSLTGGMGADTLIGGALNDTLSGGAGPDYLGGAAGNDSVTGGKGNDTLRGGKGADTLSDTEGNNNFHGGKGGDSITAGSGADTLNGNTGNDTLIAGSGAGQVLAGGPGNDSIVGAIVTGDGPDTIYSVYGSDVIQLGTNDSIIGQTSGDTVTRT